jgi:hypothetical protein
LHEEIAVVGAPFALHYSSLRVPGRRAEYELRVPLTNDMPPAPLLAVQTQLEIAGRALFAEYSAAPNQTVTVAWDGLDTFGRLVEGRQRGRLFVGYVYQPLYGRTGSFGDPAVDEVIGTARRRWTLFTE